MKIEYGGDSQKTKWQNIWDMWWNNKMFRNFLLSKINRLLKSGEKIVQERGEMKGNNLEGRNHNEEICSFFHLYIF